MYVSTILDVHKKYNALVLTSFQNDSGFVASLDKACGKFINTNSVTKKANASTKSPGMQGSFTIVINYGLFFYCIHVLLNYKTISCFPELLAKYCDHLLKKSSKNPEEAELEDTLNQVVSLMRQFTFDPPYRLAPNVAEA